MCSAQSISKKMLHRSHTAKHSVWAQIHVYRVTDLDKFPVWISKGEALPIHNPCMWEKSRCHESAWELYLPAQHADHHGRACAGVCPSRWWSRPLLCKTAHLCASSCQTGSHSARVNSCRWKTCSNILDGRFWSKIMATTYLTHTHKFNPLCTNTSLADCTSHGLSLLVPSHKNGHFCHVK